MKPRHRTRAGLVREIYREKEGAKNTQGLGHLITEDKLTRGG